MIDGHIHIERGDYSLEWIEQFVNKAVEMKIDEIRLLEHCYIFEEFMPMYDSVCAYSKYVDNWFHIKWQYSCVKPSNTQESSNQLCVDCMYAYELMLTQTCFLSLPLPPPNFTELLFNIDFHFLLAL